MTDTKTKTKTASIKIEGETKKHFDLVKQDLQERVPSMSNPDNTVVVKHGLYIAAEMLKGEI